MKRPVARLALNIEEIKAFLARYRQGECSEAEVQLIDRWFESESKEPGGQSPESRAKSQDEDVLS
jgi:hypothetical protein